MVLKILKTRILVAVLFFLSLWLTYQYMESKFLQPYSHKEKPIQLGDGRKVTVTVFYECLCPDSKSFILNHLLPSFEKAHNLLELELIPYGKAETHSTGDGYEFECQHGPAECYGNKLHSCIISRVPDEMLQLRMVSCLMEDHSDVDSGGPACAKKLGVDWAGISTCAKTTEGSNLLKIHGDSTHALSPPISFVPTILLNHNRDGQPAILKNLWKEICKYFDKDVPECH
ncbi:GILT-like protein 1 [Macrosteles quadrilineatus]|uniref:GILT-like protein 1 n=1 Tax=Macrosteles quadrilineatus TaxID=74068 RepID=UPI0023E0BA6E|nr:GILT-like protein 1 [Macrosteles quadrilineatus]